MVTCGGQSSTTRDNCKTFINGSWTHEIELEVKRWEHSSWSLSDGVLLIGGVGGGDKTEIVRDNGSTVLHYELKYEIRFVTILIWTKLDLHIRFVEGLV